MNKNRKTLKMPVRYLMNAVLVVLLFLALSYMTGNMLSTYQNKVLMTVGINIILAVSLNVATGYLGQLPLGHAGFMAVGAYTCALFTKYSPLPDGVSFAIGLALGAVMAGLFGVLIGVPALRLTGDYLAILTLGFGEIIRITLNNIDDVLGYSLFYGSKGLKNIPKYSNFANVFLCVVITCFLIHAMMKSRHGRAVLAIRDNEIAAESCGIQTTYYKVMAFAFSAAFAGLAGGLYACYIGVLNPSTFGFMKSIEILVMVVLGGMGSMLGSILSATVLTILRRSIRLPRRIAALRCRISLPRRLLHLHLLQVGRRCGAHKSAAEVHAGAHSHEACHRTASVGTGCLKAACHRALHIPLAHRRVAEHRALIPHIDEFLRFFIIGNAGDTD